MKKFHQDSSFTRLLYSPLAVIILLAMIIPLGFAVEKRYAAKQAMVNRSVGLADQLASLETRRTQLATEVEYLSNERGIEAEMRRNFDVVREGERVVVILDRDESTIEPLPALDLPTQTSTPSSPWYIFWR